LRKGGASSSVKFNVIERPEHLAKGMERGERQLIRKERESGAGSEEVYLTNSSMEMRPS